MKYGLVKKKKRVKRIYSILKIPFLLSGKESQPQNLPSGHFPPSTQEM